MTRLKWSYSVVDDRGGGSNAELLSVSIHLGVVPRSRITDDLPRAEDLSNYKVVTAGDIVINRMRAFQGAVGLSRRDGIVSPDYLVLRPALSMEPRFLHHMFRSSWFVGEMARRLRGIGSVDQGNVRTPRINEEELGEIEVPQINLNEQRAIADYLDAETARIDALITKKQQLIHLLEESLWSHLTSELRRHPTRLPLRRALRSIVDGPFGSALTSSHYVDKPETRVVRLGNIGFAEFRNDDKAYVSNEYASNLARHAVKAGDLLIAGLGDSKNHVGRATVSPPELGAAIVKADCYCAEVNRNIAIPEYLAIILSSPLGRDAVGIAGRGTTRSRINLDIAKEVEVPLPNPQRQEEIVRDFERDRAKHDSMAFALRKQLDLLAERRQALITAAVTGEFKVPGAP